MTRDNIPSNKYRNISDLRIQHYCEYRLFLKELHGPSSSPASRMGSQLHTQVIGMAHPQVWASWIVRLIVLLAIAVLCILWILWW